MRLSSDLRINTFYWETGQFRSGLHLQGKDYHFGWEHVRIRRILAPDTPLSRHDFNLGSRLDATRTLDMRVSWDENVRPGESRGLYRHGFRQVEATFGQRIHHELRLELQYLFDVESGGTTLVIRFGPELLGKSQPSYRLSL